MVVRDRLPSTCWRDTCGEAAGEMLMPLDGDTAQMSFGIVVTGNTA